ncbi:hypothetical protein B0T24DRAFT_224805 [Lasiosphaeria ovina]|uniref:Uncharacterized protein n=1 Tax=Lasiosphaeria ovina TaxID=92902 RepID=A0AAE0KHG7_9PEZI|nr:hypothetical protein B0T24DRAFT_224805 [Lasiosphaeria ovina]
MKFTIATFFALASVALAFSIEDRNARFVQPRQADVNSVDASIPAMSDRNGNVLPFNTAGVYKDATAKGL